MEMDQEALKKEQERVKQLIEERKKAKELEKEKEELEKERRRREDAKLMQEAQRKHNEEMKRREIEQAKKEKEKDLEYAQQLKEQIRRDREERLARATASSSSAPTISSSSSATPSQSASTSAPATSSSSTFVPNQATLKIRLPDATTVTEVFDANATIAQVRSTLAEKHNLKEKFFLRQNLPPKTFEDHENHKTVKELGLVPNAALTVVSEETIGKPNPTSANASNQDWLSWSYNLVMSFFGYGPEPAQPPPSMPGKFQGGVVHHIHNSRDYDDAKSYRGLVVVDFSAAWCGPCKMIAPVFESLAKSNPSVLFLHVDIDEMRGAHSDLSDVKSVPTFKFFKGGKLVHSFSGASVQQLESAVQRHR